MKSTSNLVVATPRFVAPALALCIGACAGLATGCAAPESDAESGAGGEDAVAEWGDALNGDISFPDSSCSQTEKDKLELVLEQAYDWLYFNPTPIKACLQNAFMSPDNGQSPEVIFDLMRQNLPTAMSCAEDPCNNTGFAACATIGIPSESVTWDHNTLAGSSVESLAAILLHEVAHNKGFVHMSGEEYDYSVTQQIRSCARYGVPAAGVAREDLEGEVELGRVGGDGGGPFYLSCGNSEFVTGMNVESSTNIHGMYLKCTPPAGGTTYNRGPVGATDGSTVYNEWCGAGRVVIGFSGRSSDLVDRLSMRCADISAVQAGSTAYTSVFLGGGQGGTTFSRMCPAGMAVKRLYGRAGARIDEMKIVCQDIDNVETRIFFQSPMIGTAEGRPDDERCTGYGSMIGLYGRSGAEVDRLGGICQPLERPSAGADLQRDSGGEHIVAAAGGDGGADFEDRCPADMALVGLNVRSGSRVDRVQGICAKMTKWKSGATIQWGTDTANLGLHGGAGGSASQQLCAQGKWLVGWETWDDNAPVSSGSLHGLRLFCRSL